MTIQMKIQEVKTELLLLGLQESDPLPKLYNGNNLERILDGSFWFKDNQLYVAQQGEIYKAEDPRLFIIGPTLHQARMWCNHHEISTHDTNVRLIHKTEQLIGMQGPIHYVLIGEIHKISLRTLQKIDEIDAITKAVELDSRTYSVILYELERMRDGYLEDRSI